MARKYWGSIPFADRLDDIPVSYALFSGSMYAENYVNSLGDLHTRISYILSRSVALDFSGPVGTVMATFPLESTNGGDPTDLELIVTAHYNFLGTDMTSFGFKANSDLHMSDIHPLGACPDTNTLWICLFDEYTDSGADEPNSVEFYFACMQGKENYTNPSGTLDRVSLVVLDGEHYRVPLWEGDPDLGPDSTPSGYGKKIDGTPTTHPPFDHTSKPIPVPVLPTIGVSTAGFYHIYKVTQGLLNDFGEELFPSLQAVIQDITGIQTTDDILKLGLQFLIAPGLFFPAQTVDQTISIVDMVLNGKAIDYVVDCHIIPVNPSTSGSEKIKCGAREINITASKVNTDYVEFDCGSVSIPLNFQNFLDFQGTRAKLFLPFVGFVDIKPEFWNGGTLNVRYHFNVVDGSFMAFVVSSSGQSQLYNTVIGQYSGSCCIHIPVTGLNYASMLSGMLATGAGLTGSVVSGNVAGAVGSALTMLNNTPDAPQSNAYNSAASFMGCRRPYLLIERCVPSMSGSYPHSEGFPLNVSLPLSALQGTGYTEIEDIDLTGINATDAEIEELKTLLTEGFYI